MPEFGAGFFKLIDWMPFSLLLPLALILLLAPFKPMPHVWEKLLLLKDGILIRPLDVFDLVFHLLPTILVAIKIIRHVRR